MSFRAQLLPPGTTGSPTGTPVDASRCPWLKVYLKGDGGVINAGVITLEEADYFLGETAPTNWSSIGTINATDVSAGVTQKATPLAIGAYSNIRARVTTPITGPGTVTLTLAGTGSE